MSLDSLESDVQIGRYAGQAWRDVGETIIHGQGGIKVASNRSNHHEIDYIEFAVTDMAQSQRFYEAAFGWKFNDYGAGYAGIQKHDGGEAGGLRVTSEVLTGGPLVILYSSDLERSLDAVRAAGGAIVQEPFEFPGGRRFHFKDPSGNELAVWSDK